VRESSCEETLKKNSKQRSCSSLSFQICISLSNILALHYGVDCKLFFYNGSQNLNAVAINLRSISFEVQNLRLSINSQLKTISESLHKMFRTRPIAKHSMLPWVSQLTTSIHWLGAKLLLPSKTTCVPFYKSGTYGFWKKT